MIISCTIDVNNLFDKHTHVQTAVKWNIFHNDNEISHLNSRANDYKNDEGLQIIRATNRGWYRPWQTGGKMALRLKVERIYRADINWVVETSFVLRFQSHNKSADQPMSFSANVWSPLFKTPYQAAKPIIRRSQDFLFLLPNLSSFHLWSNAHHIIQHTQLNEKVIFSGINLRITTILGCIKSYS